MCAIFGLLDYKGDLDPAQRIQIISEPGTAAEVRGTDATGIAFFHGGKLCIQKAPRPAHKMKYRIPNHVQHIMGHTRMTTQGSAKKNQNNHPFSGKAGGKQFALAHNGILYNDRRLREEHQLPQTSIETDSYVAVQLVEQQQEVSFDILQRMAEELDGPFTFTILDQDNSMYFVKGDNPLTIYHYSKLGIHLYASTEEILWMALENLRIDADVEVIHPRTGEILRVDSQSQKESGQFFLSDPFSDFDFPCRQESRSKSHVTQQEYIQAVKTVAAFHGYEEEYIDVLLADGYITDDIETMIYCGRM